MGLNKECDTRGRARDRRDPPGGAASPPRSRVPRSLAKWANQKSNRRRKPRPFSIECATRYGPGRSPPHEGEAPEDRMTFNRFADLYIERYVKARQLASADTIDYRMAPIGTLRDQVAGRDRSADIEDFVAAPKEPTV